MASRKIRKAVRVCVKWSVDKVRSLRWEDISRFSVKNVRILAAVI